MNRTLQEALGDLSSTRADLESATEEVGRNAMVGLWACL